MSATVKDVAKAAKVSIGTVSRVLSGEPNVAEHTVAKVMEAVDRLNYTRLRRRKSFPDGQALRRKNVALMLMGMDQSLVALPSVASGIHGAQGALADAGANVLLFDLPTVGQLPRAFTQKQIHAVLAKGALQSQMIAKADAELVERLRALPTVWFLGRPQHGDWGDVVESDSSEVGRLAAEHLLLHGHRRIAILNPKPDHVTMGKICASFTWHATQGGASVENVFGNEAEWHLPLGIVEDVEVVDQLVGRLLEMPTPPTAVFAPADSVAALIYRSCARRGLVIGRDISLVSCNNEVPLLTGLYPALTTIDIAAEQIGQQAAKQLIERLADPQATTVIVAVQPRLIEGMSVAHVD